MENFEKIRESVESHVKGELVSPELRPLLEDAYQQINTTNPKLSAIKVSLENLFVYLTTPTGRTSANCHATDLFFTLADWNVNWKVHPEQLKEIIDDIGGALHDTITHPEVAQNFNSLPEQLLDRIHNLESKSDGP